LKWIEANARHQRSPWEIAQWTAWRETATPSDVETREFFNDYHKTCGAEREDIVTWPDLLDLDDHVTFGGKA
jgi:hypothetical protein